MTREEETETNNRIMSFFENKIDVNFSNGNGWIISR